MTEKVVYISGPYRAEAEWRVRQNIADAAEAASSVWALGAVAICPHKNSEGFGGLVDDEVILRGDLKLLSMCDVVLMLLGWESSTGATREHGAAEELGIPIVYDLLNLANWLDAQRVVA